MAGSRTLRLYKALGRHVIAATAVSMLAGCAVVRELQPSVIVRSMAPNEYVALRRGDILGTGRLSVASLQTIHGAGLDEQACAPTTSTACIGALAAAEGIADEPRLSTLAELWLQRAVSPPAAIGPDDAAAVSAWLEAARHAYAYLFFGRRSPGERAFEERQTQVRDWYNFAVQQSLMHIFRARVRQASAVAGESAWALRLEDWTLRFELRAQLPGGAMPRDLVPAPSLAFQGLRSAYRRDGFGAEFVAVTDDHPETPAMAPEAHSNFGRQTIRRNSPPVTGWTEMPTPNVTAVFRFDAQTLDGLLGARELVVGVHDPLTEDHLTLHGRRVPLAGNFTAGYGLWLAHSGFNEQSLRSLFGRERGIEHPHLYLMQPFDPQRRVIVMLHGLASSPEAWVNVANELLGDEQVRRNFQIWQVHYPTNMPVSASHAAIRQLLLAALRHFDPNHETPASRGLVLIGHSMGGMIARLMVSTADEQLWAWASTDPRIDLDRLADVRSELEPLLRFQPFQGVERAIFIAAPHRGTAMAGHGLARWVSGLIRLPLTLLEAFGEAFQARTEASAARLHRLLERIPNGIDQLDENDPFVMAASELPIPDRVTYHSIIARLDANGPLADSNDGLVPYRSAHLDGAASEKIIVSGHSVQESSASILEIRRILREDVGKPLFRPDPPAAPRAAPPA